MDSSKLLIVVVGPTAIGKTAISVTIAKQLQTEILSADARQFYKDMAIGTAQPTKQEMDGIVHHFIGVLPVTAAYNAKSFEVDALAVLEKLFKTNDCVILTGGSGLYIHALCNGLDKIPIVSEDVRKHINLRLETEGLDTLLQELSVKDQLYYDNVDKKNPRRIIKALEVITATKQPYSSFITNKHTVRSFDMFFIGLIRDRQELYDRIKLRIDTMVEKGLFEEARLLYPFRDLNALQTIGYKEIFEYMDDLCSKEEAIDKLKKHTQNYAKRQISWFKRNKDIHWFHPDDPTIVHTIKSHITKCLSQE